ncbi:hypothetical protein ACFY2K_31580 [Kitasatospora sp. NPDC001309]|uniref:hypothetical protein n=1 Tax=Kitasatospora sp. NPDC001309 TaxID=3364013 RepID=UPI00367C72BB
MHHPRPAGPTGTTRPAENAENPESRESRENPAGRWRTVTAAAVAAALVSSAATAWWLSADDGLDYVNDYASHEPLRVVGYPSTGTLHLTQQIVWRLADGSEGSLATMATSDGSGAEARSTAANWVRTFREGAQGPVTAEFHGEGEVRQSVVLYFGRTRQVKQFRLRLDGNGGADGWRVLMRETDPQEAAAPPTWAPASPGATLPPAVP